MSLSSATIPPVGHSGHRARGKGARLATDAGILMITELFVRLFDALVSIILARYLAPQGFGLMAFAFSYSNLFSFLPGFGMGSLGMRDVAKDPSQMSRHVSNGLVAKLVLAIATMALIWVATIVLHYAPDKQAVVLVAGTMMILETNIRYILSFFQAVQRMSTVAITNIAVRVGWVIGSIAIMLWHGGVLQLVVVRALVTGVGFMTTIMLLERQIQRIHWSIEPAFIWGMLKASFPFALFKLFGQLYTDIDTVMLSSMKGDLVTGWYAAGYKIMRLFGFIQGGFFGAFLPAMSRFSGANAKHDMIVAMRRACRYLLIISLPIAGGVCVLADQVVTAFYGPDYYGAIPAMRILIWSMVLDFLNSAMIAAIASVNHEKKASYYLIIGCVCSALSNLLVVPLWGHIGAAMTTVLAESVVFALQLRMLQRSLPELRLLEEFVRPILVTGIMMAATWMLRGFGLFGAIAGASLVYVPGLFALRLIGRDEWRIATQMVRFRPEGQHL